MNKKVKLKEIIDFKNGYAFKSNEFKDNGIPIIRIGNISEDKLDLSDLKYYDENSSLDVYQIFNNDILIAMSGATTGKIALNKFSEKLYLNQRIGSIRAKECTIPTYIFYFLKKNKEYLLSLASGSAQPNLSSNQIKNIEIPFLSLEQQKQIAKTLDKANELINLRKESITKLDALAKSIFIDMFGDPVSNPKGWEVVSIDSVCDEIVDCINRTAPLSDKETEYKMIRTTNVRNHKIVFNETRYVEKDIYEKWVRRLVPKKYDIVFTREAPVGEAGVIITDEKFFLGQRTMLYRPNFEKVNSFYLLFELMGTNINNQINKISTGSTVKHLSVPDCKKFNINLPPINLQNKFAKIIEKIEEQKSLYEKELEKLEENFQALLQKSFQE